VAQWCPNVWITPSKINDEASFESIHLTGENRGPVVGTRKAEKTHTPLSPLPSAQSPHRGEL
jgi:hypothetical protein